MALPLEWYDFLCFGIVGASFLVSFWVLWRKEGNRRGKSSQQDEDDDTTFFHGLLAGRRIGSMGSPPAGRIGADQLWESCWKGVHPGWLLGTRFVSFVVMAGFLTRDVIDWGDSIYVYYTDLTFFSKCTSTLHLNLGIVLVSITVLSTMSSSDLEIEASGLAYSFQWQVPFSALSIIVPIIISINTIKKQLNTKALHSRDLWVSNWRNLSPIWLFVYRAFAFICLARVLFDSLAFDGVFAFYFYTQWTFTLVMLYFAIGTVISGHGCWWAGKSNHNHGFLDIDMEEPAVINMSTGAKMKRLYSSEEESIQKAGFWGYLMQTIYQASAGAVVITDIMFWCVIVPFLSTERFRLNWLMGCMHTLNAFFLLIDTALNSLPFPWFRLAYFVLWTCSYVVFQWVLHACGFSWWPYPFMEMDTPWAPLWYLAVALFHIPCYGIYALIVKAKNTVLPRLFPRAFLRSS